MVGLILAPAVPADAVGEGQAMARIYTRTGDQGSTALYGGTRVAKDHLRVEAYGTIDELNSVIGLARAAKPDPQLDAALARIQNELFECGADLADPQAGPDKKRPFRLREEHILRLEREIDAFTAETPPLAKFILPGGGELGARLHMARTVARRAERRTVTAASAGLAGQIHVKYLNRLSDWLFAAARAANYREAAVEVTWDPAPEGD